MNRTLRWGAILMAVSAVACAGPEEQAPALESATVTVTLPEGDPQAGRQAFQDLRCTACHAVPSDPDMPAPVSSTPGPAIDATVARGDISYVLASIMTPSHAISLGTSEEVRGRLEGVLSPMGDFSRVMTVSQLVDLHAYVRSFR